MAGFRIGRGRDNRTPQRPPQQAPQAPPYGHPGNGNGHPGPGQARPGSGQQPPYYGGNAPQQWPQAQQPYGEPEYFGDPYGQQGQGHQGQNHPGQPGHPGRHPGAHQGQHDPYAANNPGHTQAFTVGDDPYGDGATYRAGAAPAPPTGPRLHWKDLLSGVVLRPNATFWQMRDYPVWGPALIVTFAYGLLAIFGFDQAREEAISAPIGTAIPYALMAAVGFVLGGLILGAVTHTLARQLGGDGSWQPTVGLSMLITSITDAPRLLFALFLGGENGLVQVLGWVTWLAAGALLTSMVSRSHDLPWPKALGASAIQLIALLSIIKLGTI
ncbi:Yip1 family protein [Streptomyces sp. NPDC001941]|uniref:Yip1 family protein n=1 Tax=Streptomyces sp. NPDC001941 TaxID=3154659 RepID=UPI00331A7DD6